MCDRLGWDMHIHQLRHYAATELIAAGVDVRTVAGRLGHGGGDATTLRYYTAWVSEADQRAAGSIVGRMPAVRSTSTMSPTQSPADGHRPARATRTCRLTPAVVKAITGIDEQAWTPIRYPNAIFDAACSPAAPREFNSVTSEVTLCPASSRA